MTSFEGLGDSFTGFTVQAAPPDTNGDIGPANYVQTVNSDLVIFDKHGAVLYGPVGINTLWSGFGGGCQTNNDGDPVVLYDPIADRWVISQFSVSTTPFLECVAVSQTNDPTGKYNRYSFSYTDFPDYPKMGIWPDAYYTTFNMFNAAGTTFLGAEICAYDRAKMLAGQTATQQCFQTANTIGGLLPADLDGATQPPAGSPGYAVALGSAANQLAFYKFHVDWSTPASSTFTGPINLSTAAFSEACAGGTCISQSGTTQKLDSLADRLMYRLAYRNFSSHEAMVVSHTVTAGNSTGIRWYELRLTAGQPSIFQQGTYAPDSNFRWLPSIAMDRQGNMLLGFSLSGNTLHPQIQYTGRLASDPLGQMTQGESNLATGNGSETTGLSRWGDYSMMSVDPTDDLTFWFTSEYIPSNGTFNWRTRIGSFRFLDIDQETKWITSLYADLLGRSPDPDGLKNWLAVRQSGGSLEQVVTGFLNSEEYATLQTRRLYRQFLDRDPDATGLQGWVAQLKQGVSLQEIIRGFCDSVEYKSNNPVPDKFVESLYRRLLGRTSDPGGKASWISQLSRGVATAEIINGFLRSTEYNTQRVIEFYQLFLGRGADPTGLAFWVNAAITGKSFQEIKRGFLESDEYRNRALTRF